MNNQAVPADNVSNIDVFDDAISSTVRLPLIKRGWIRALLGMLLATLFSGITIIPIMISGVVTEDVLTAPASEMFAALGYELLALLMFTQLIGSLLAVVFMRKYVDRQSIISLGFSFSGYKVDMLKGGIWGVGLIGSGFIILYALGFITISSVEVNAISWLFAILLFVFVSLNEEIIIRGYVLGNLKASMNKYWALVISAVLFMIMHLANANLSVLPILNLFLAGIMLGIYTVHTGNLWFPIGMHFSWNFFQGPILGFEVSGSQVDSVISQQVMGSPFITGGEFGFEGSLLLTAMMLASIFYIDRKYKKCS